MKCKKEAFEKSLNKNNQTIFLTEWLWKIIVNSKIVSYINKKQDNEQKMFSIYCTHINSIPPQGRMTELFYNRNYVQIFEQ